MVKTLPGTSSTCCGSTSPTVIRLPAACMSVAAGSAESIEQQEDEALRAPKRSAASILEPSNRGAGMELDLLRALPFTDGDGDDRDVSCPALASPCGIFGARPSPATPARLKAAGSFPSLCRWPRLRLASLVSAGCDTACGRNSSGAYGSIGTLGAGSELSTKVSSDPLVQVVAARSRVEACPGLPDPRLSSRVTTRHRTLPRSRFLSGKQQGMARLPLGACAPFPTAKACSSSQSNRFVTLKLKASATNSSGDSVSDFPMVLSSLTIPSNGKLSRVVRACWSKARPTLWMNLMPRHRNWSQTRTMCGNGKE
mmetsp:Transcript_4730/g.11459  ORF Transcript_4730/g.11459 Transcript_4730/m.11459 type:complete len:312 (-) Transcript_4730:569-1504(-)